MAADGVKGLDLSAAPSGRLRTGAPAMAARSSSSRLSHIALRFLTACSRISATGDLFMFSPFLCVLTVCPVSTAAGRKSGEVPMPIRHPASWR